MPGTLLTKLLCLLQNRFERHLLVPSEQMNKFYYKNIERVLDGGNFKFGKEGDGIVATDRAVESGGKDICDVENLGSPKCGAEQMPTISVSNDSNFLGLKPCSSSVTEAADVKSCTCSFCSKGDYYFHVI